VSEPAVIDLDAATAVPQRRAAPARWLTAVLVAVSVLWLGGAGPPGPDLAPEHIVEGVFDRLLTTVQHRFDALHLPSWPLAQLLVFWGGVQLGYDGFQHNPVDYAGAVTCPTLVMRGERDPWVTGAETQALAARIGAPKRVVEVPGVGHEMPFVYPAPDLWVATVKRFLALEE